jgi:hypothetical protein
VVESDMASKTPMEANKSQDGSSGRLSMEAKYHLRQELNLIAREKCDSHIRSFAEVRVNFGSDDSMTMIVY